MLSVIAFILFVVAGILNLVKERPELVLWLVIIGGACVAADVAWGWYGRRYPRG